MLGTPVARPSAMACWVVRSVFGTSRSARSASSSPTLFHAAIRRASASAKLTSRLSSTPHRCVRCWWRPLSDPGLMFLTWRAMASAAFSRNSPGMLVPPSAVLVVVLLWNSAGSIGSAARSGMPLTQVRPRLGGDTAYSSSLASCAWPRKMQCFLPLVRRRRDVRASLGEVSFRVPAGLRSDRGQPGALYPRGRHPDSGAVRVAGRYQDGGAVGGLDNAGCGARPRCVGLRDACGSCDRLRALRGGVRTLPHRLDCD